MKYSCDIDGSFLSEELSNKVREASIALVQNAGRYFVTSRPFASAVVNVDKWVFDALGSATDCILKLSYIWVVPIQNSFGKEEIEPVGMILMSDVLSEKWGMFESSSKNRR